MSSGRIALGDLTPENLEVLRRINTSVLPARYAEKWYKESLEVGELAKLGTYGKFFKAISRGLTQLVIQEFYLKLDNEARIV
jgi:hypothetical protein